MRTDEIVMQAHALCPLCSGQMNFRPAGSYEVEIEKGRFVEIHYSATYECPACHVRLTAQEMQEKILYDLDAALIGDKVLPRYILGQVVNFLQVKRDLCDCDGRERADAQLRQFGRSLENLKKRIQCFRYFASKRKV